MRSNRSKPPPDTDQGFKRKFKETQQFIPELPPRNRHMPPVHQHSRMQFLPSIPHTVTPKFRILPLPTAHRMLFLGDGSGESPADLLLVCFLRQLLLQNNYLLGKKKEKKIYYCFCQLKIPGFQSELHIVYVSRRGKKILRSSSSPAAMVGISFWVSFTTLTLSRGFYKAINSTTPGYSNHP